MIDIHVLSSRLSFSRHARAACAALFALAAIACGGSGGGGGADAGSGGDAGACGPDYRSGSCIATTPERSCTEMSGSAALIDTARAECEGAGHTWSSAACSREGSVGGCGMVQVCGTSQVSWLYEGGSLDLEAHRSACVMGGGSFFEP